VRVHQRLSAFRTFACWQLLQQHVGPQLQTSPHWHEAVAAAEVWQPQVHWIPTQVSHPRTFD
jgi:hypothetical protein